VLPATFDGVDWHIARAVADGDRAGHARAAVTGSAFGAVPGEVARGVARNRLLAVRLRRAAGTLVELRGDAPATVWSSPFIATTYVDGPGGRLAVDVALPRALGDRLVTAATPLARERLVLAGVLTLGGLFAAAAALGLRRERQLARARSLFLATVSHELRTPIAHVTALSETMLLGRAESPEQARRWLRVIHREGQRLGALTANVLLHARGEHRGISVTPQRTDLAPWADDVAGLVAATAEARGARVAVDAAPVAVWVDPALLRHAVLNLLDNALKFGPDGQTVRLSARIWRPFVRLSEGGDSPGGTGLGLDVVRRVTEQLGGSVEVGDAPGGGARFTLRLPRAGHRPAGDAGAAAPHAAV
jgi:signal transduction histidine kinase